MPELRWILLGAGVIFLVALALWESRRQRRLPSQPVEEPTQHRFREPTLGLPEIRPREAVPELPVVEIDDSMVGLRVDGVRIEEDLVAVDAPAVDNIPILEAPPEELSDSVEPVIAWPPEEQRRLISVRVSAKAGERLSGRAIRLALGAEGFLHGKYAIFHKSGPDARVVVSAASLSKPGCFDLETMDSQRYGGLGLFTVLPGHLPTDRMLDELLESARNIADRLEGVVQDEHGAPLDAERVAALRAHAEGGPTLTTAEGSRPAESAS